MKKSLSEPKFYEAPKLVEFGDIRRLTSAAAGDPGRMDAMYYMGYINNLNGCVTDQSFS